MKKSISASLFLAASISVAQADQTAFVSGDGSALSAVCIAVLDSRQAGQVKAAEVGIPKSAWQDLACNGMPINKFAKFAQPDSAPVEHIAVKTADASLETQLCVAAVTSPEQYATLKQTYFSNITNLEDKVQCNGRSLKNFMVKYSNANLTAAL